MVAETIQYINWFDSAGWSSLVILGSKEVYYNFKVEWNSRGEYWSVTISTLDDIPIIQGRKIVLGVDLLSNCYSIYKPDCILYSSTDNQDITRIEYDNMVSGNVKLYNIRAEDLR